MRSVNITLCVLALLFLTLPAAFSLAQEESRASYVGSKACQSCHDEQYASYTANSGMARSWSGVAKMLPKLSEAEKRDCYACHTQGYGKPGGFVSLEATPDMANLSCETCHGPGSLHSETGDPANIRRTPDIEACRRCHNAERVENFKFKPVLYQGGH